MNTQDLSPETQAQIDHLAGKHVVVEYVYADGKGTRFLLESLGDESDAAALWDDVAFSNGPPLVEIRMRWDQKQADELREHFAVAGQSVGTSADATTLQPENSSVSAATQVGKHD